MYILDTQLVRNDEKIYHNINVRMFNVYVTFRLPEDRYGLKAT